MRPGDTPVLIPNTTVKTRAADGTMLETAWESRRAPDFWGYSSAGRAPALQAGGQGFESPYLQEAIIGAHAAGFDVRAGRKACFPNEANGKDGEGIRRMPVMKQAEGLRIPRKKRGDKFRERDCRIMIAVPKRFRQ